MRAGGQEDRKTDGEGQGRGGGDSGRNVPSRRISPLTLLSYKEGYHSRWRQRRSFFFEYNVTVPDGPEWAAQNGERQWVGLSEGGISCTVSTPDGPTWAAGAEKKEGDWELEEVNVQVMSLQTALNGRPGLYLGEGRRWDAESRGHNQIAREPGPGCDCAILLEGEVGR